MLQWVVWAGRTGLVVNTTDGRNWRRKRCSPPGPCSYTTLVFQEAIASIPQFMSPYLSKMLALTLQPAITLAGDLARQGTVSNTHQTHANQVRRAPAHRRLHVADTRRSHRWLVRGRKGRPDPRVCRLPSARSPCGSWRAPRWLRVCCCRPCSRRTTCWSRVCMALRR